MLAADCTLLYHCISTSRPFPCVEEDASHPLNRRLFTTTLLLFFKNNERLQKWWTTAKGYWIRKSFTQSDLCLYQRDLIGGSKRRRAVGWTEKVGSVLY